MLNCRFVANDNYKPVIVVNISLSKSPVHLSESFPIWNPNDLQPFVWSTFSNSDYERTCITYCK